MCAKKTENNKKSKDDKTKNSKDDKIKGKINKRVNFKKKFPKYIYNVLKLVHPDLGISNKAMSIMCCFVQSQFENIAREAKKIIEINNK